MIVELVSKFRRGSCLYTSLRVITTITNKGAIKAKADIKAKIRVSRINGALTKGSPHLPQIRTPSDLL